MKTITDKFKEDLLKYLSDVNSNNFEERYDGVFDIILNYKEQGISRQNVIEIIVEIGRMDLNSGQDELLVEASNRVEGFCSPGKEIKW